MKLKISILFFMLIIISFIKTLSPNFNIYSDSSDKMYGVNLDCARVYHSPDYIKKYINDIHNSGGNYILLHLNDNERFGVESETLDQTVNNARKVNDTYYNPKTNLAFLSKNQLLDIINYGYTHRVQVIPEIDVPGHAQSIFKLLSYTKNGKNLVDKIKNTNGYNEMYYQKEETVDFSKKLIHEYLGMLPKNSYFSIGGDEISVDNHENEKNVAKYINKMDNYINYYGLNMMMWNDSFHKSVINKYNKNILINYWSLSGEVSDKDEYNNNVRLRATMPELNHAGFKTINCNNYYTYIILDKSSFTKNSFNTWKKELQRWNPEIWNDEHNKELDKSKNNIGASISVWGETNGQYNDAKTYESFSPFVKIFLNKFKKAS
ncbi:family 20 glycosylhydrolase [Apilactobacillus sp. M161]|uniref:beta-N-acetylhexosaminidase n=1 Tax=Apilactobacillus xinyiensis TaxID=2841032 RepID=A0ABT0HZK1_9LACO|nr:family 20 glycosylhydrolase [Apilactobacillus xinyiensis]MCK8624005.1 family 20 glycosylhydrolase [Apilactobacillus xinyiensis]